MRDFINEIPAGDFKSTAMEALWRVRRSLVGGGLEEVVARSIRRTEAPLSARRRPAKGPTLDWISKFLP
jgi:hypothetical protein